MKFAGRIALVTGASQGIGRGCAVELAKEGAKVGVNYNSNSEEAAEVVEEIERLGGEAIAIQANVADQSAVDAMVQNVVERWGRLDLFVSNAAYSERLPMIHADMEGFKRTVDISMWGAFYGVRAAALQMVKQGEGGAMTVVSSPHADVPVRGAMAYNMSKAANDSMAKTAAIELAEHKIRVNVVHPGWTDTPGERRFFSEEQLAEGSSILPIPRLGSIEEIGKAVVYTLSDDAAFMTGGTLLIDGGFSLPWWSEQRGTFDG